MGNRYNFNLHIEQHNDKGCMVFNEKITGGFFMMPGAILNTAKDHDEYEPKDHDEYERKDWRRSAARHEDCVEYAEVVPEHAEAVPDGPFSEDKLKRVIADITRRFRFSGHQLGSLMVVSSDGQKSEYQVTNADIRSLFSACFSKKAGDNRAKMWTMLTENRFGAEHVENEAFFRTTVLNIIGLFKAYGLLRGASISLAMSVFDVKTKSERGSCKKSVDRGCNFMYHAKISPLPVVVKHCIDLWMEQLSAGFSASE